MNKKKNKPLVSIILPAYNVETCLRESIDSVLRQDFKNFELIIINDGSTDGTQRIIEEYSKRDSRIVPINQKNIKLVATLNKGVGLARGKYIARIDGDDPWMEGKLSVQVSELEKDKGLVLIGGGFEIIDENGFYIETVSVPVFDDDIRRTLMLRNAFGHSSVVFRKTAFNKVGGYVNSCGPTEDYDLWIKLSNIGLVKNLAYPVYRYRVHRKSISQQNSASQAIETKKHINRLWQNTPPKTIKRQELVKKSRIYLHTSKLSWYSIALKEQYLADNAQIGIKMLRYRMYLKGISQLMHVASTGRTGVKAVLRRLRKLDMGSIKQLGNYQPKETTNNNCSSQVS